MFACLFVHPSVLHPLPGLNDAVKDESNSILHEKKKKRGRERKKERRRKKKETKPDTLAKSKDNEK